MKLTLHIEYEVEDRNAARELANEVMPGIYKARFSSDPEAWTWDVEDED